SRTILFESLRGRPVLTESALDAWVNELESTEKYRADDSGFSPYESVNANLPVPAATPISTESPRPNWISSSAKAVHGMASGSPASPRDLILWIRERMTASFLT